MSDTQRTNRPRLESAEELKTKASQKRKSHSKWFTVLILLLVIALLAGAYFLTQALAPEEEAVPETTNSYTPSETVYLLDRDASEVASFTVTKAEKDPFTILVSVDDEGNASYTLEGDPEFPLNPESLEQFRRYCSYMSASQMIEENAQDLSIYGLDTPSVSVSVTYTDGTQTAFDFGSKMPTGQQYYFRFQDENTVYLSYFTPYTVFTTTLNELYIVESPFMVASAENVTSLLVEQKGKDTIELGYLDESEKNIAMSSLRLMQPFFYEAHADRAPMAFESAIAVTLGSYAGTLENLTDTGLALDEEPVAHVRVEDMDGNLTEYWVGNHADETNRYVRVDDSGRVYLMSADSLAFLEEMVPTRLMTQFSNLVNIQMVDSIDITLPDVSYEISLLREVNEEGKTVTRYFFDGKETAEKKFKTFYQVLIGLMNSKLSDDMNFTGDPYMTLTFHLNEDNGDFTVQFLEYDDQYYAVLRDGQTLFLMKHSTLQQLVDALSAYNAPVQ